MMFLEKKKTIGELFSEYLISAHQLNQEELVEIELADPKELLIPDRIDLVCKLYYIHCFETEKNLKFAKELYSEHIKAFSNGTYTEPGNKDKNSIEKYFVTFEKLIMDIKTNGFDTKRSVVPVDCGGKIIDGSHRTAIAIYYNIPLPIVRLKNLKSRYNYNFEFFRNRGLKEEYLDYMAYQFLMYSDKVYVACLWPRVYDIGGLEIAEKYIAESTGVIYKKHINLNYNGLKQLMINLYGKQEWAGTFNNGFAGIDRKVDLCYKKNASTTVYVITGAEIEQITQLKSKIRDFFCIGNHSIHITDTKEEAINAAQALLNNNSIYLMNYGNPTRFTPFINKLLVFKEALVQNNLRLDDFLVDSGSILSLFGLRDTNDIDYLTEKQFSDNLPKSQIYENHLNYNYNCSIEELLYDPRNHMYYEGIKFVSLSRTKEMKINRKDKKDKNDIRLIKRLNKRAYIYKLIETIGYIKNKISNDGICIIIYRIWRKVYRFIGYVYYQIIKRGRW